MEETVGRENFFLLRGQWWSILEPVKQPQRESEKRIGGTTMQAVITVATMRESDAYTIANFVPSKTLMYRAAMGVYQAAQWKGPVGILTGGGNNGDPGRPRHSLHHLSGVGNLL